MTTNCTPLLEICGCPVTGQGDASAAKTALGFSRQGLNKGITTARFPRRVESHPWADIHHSPELDKSEQTAVNAMGMSHRLPGLKEEEASTKHDDLQKLGGNLQRGQDGNHPYLVPCGKWVLGMIQVLSDFLL